MKYWKSMCHQCVGWVSRHRHFLGMGITLVHAFNLSSCAATPQKPAVSDLRAANDQHRKVRNDESSPRWKSDRVPHPVGGFDALMYKMQMPAEFLRNAKHGEAGNVKVQAWIGADGILRKVQMMNSADPVLVAAVVRALRGVSWIPARKNGKPVASSFVLPVTFRVWDKPPEKEKRAEQKSQAPQKLSAP